MTTQRTTGVWISATSATVLRWGPEGVTVRERFDSMVPGRHRSTGRPPTEDRPSAEGHRDEHMRAFFARVSGTVPFDDDLLLVGDGEVVSISRTRSEFAIKAATWIDASRWTRAAR